VFWSGPEPEIDRIDFNLPYLVYSRAIPNYDTSISLSSSAKEKEWQIFKSTDRGMHWTVISPDLSRNDKSKQGPSGGPVSKDQASAEYYDLIYSVAESPKQKGLIWAGTDDGLVWVTRDGGAHWNNVTPKDLPAWSKVSVIDPSPESAGTAYVAVTRLKNDDLRPYAWKTTDYGKTWTAITNGMPVGAVVRAVREDPKQSNLLFAGTALGVYVSFNDGALWQPLKLNLPTVPVRDLAIKDGELAIATHGRAFWILDDITPLRQLTAATLNEPAHLFRPAPAVRFRSGGSYLPPGAAVGKNPPEGVIVDYYLKSKPDSEVTLQILDAKGKVIRSFSSEEKSHPSCPGEIRRHEHGESLPIEPGLNRFEWDMRYETPVDVPCAVYDEGGPLAPLALPGQYEARLTVGGNTFTAPIQIVPDPREKVTEADLAKQFDLTAKLRDLMQQDHVAVLEIRDVNAQLDALKKRLGGDGKAKDIVDAAEAVQKKMTAVEDALIQSDATASEDMLNYPIELNSKIGYLINGVDSADSAPPQQDWDLYAVYQKQVDGWVAKWKAIVSSDLARLNRQIRHDNIPAVAPRPVANGNESSETR